MGIALVTGGNRGIGLETCRQLAQADWQVLLAGRDARAAAEAVRALGKPNVRALQLDVTDPASVARLARLLAAEGTRLEALVNNAAVMHRGISEQIARDTLGVNFQGAVRVTDALLPQLAPRANIVMVSSAMGELDVLSEGLRARLTDPGLRREDLAAMADECVRGVIEGSLIQRGYPANVYSVSKALLNGFTRVLSRELAGTDIKVNAVCPGWVQTRMGGSHAPRSVADGARGIVWAATRDADGPKAQFLRDGAAIAW